MEKIKNKKRVISNDELIEATKNPNINNLIKYYSSKFKNQIELDQRKSISLYALWRCLQYYKPNNGKKFTSNLMDFLRFEFLREVKKNKKYERTIDKEKFFERKNHDSFFDIEINDFLSSIKDSNVSIATKQYYIEKRKIKEIAQINNWSIKKTKKFLDDGLNKLQEIWSEK